MSSSSAASSESPLHIISWNVAGWIPTLKHIVARHGSLGAFLRRHQIDVLALQESKVPPKTLSNASDHQPDCEGYDSYWAPCRIPGSSFNGVAVYARRGLVRAAHRDVLGDSEFDDEGRCIRIDIGGRLVLFNVYVPNSGSTSQRSDYKVRYLARLRWAMAKVRESGTPVMLVGDYNIARRVHDRDWRHRSADIQAMIDAPLGGGGGRGGGGGEGEGRSGGGVENAGSLLPSLPPSVYGSGGGGGSGSGSGSIGGGGGGGGGGGDHAALVQKMLRQLQKIWPSIYRQMGKKYVAPVVVKKGQGTVTKYRVEVPGEGGRRIILGRPREEAEYVEERRGEKRGEKRQEEKDMSCVCCVLCGAFVCCEL